MTLPRLSSLPTDNLYKFMALSGVAVALSCILGAALVFKTTVPRLLDLKAEIPILDLELKYLREDTEEVKQEAKAIEIGAARLPRSFPNAKLPKNGPANLRTPTRELNELLQRQRDLELKERDLRLRSRDIELKDTRLHESVEEVSELSWWMFCVSLICLLAFGAGCLIAGWGFLLWYGRVQKLQDEVLRRQAGKAAQANSSGPPLPGPGAVGGTSV